ncbi:MAG: hypothetical protein QXO00_07575 [Candidatus Bathyarchaeia archaeon]
MAGAESEFGLVVEACKMLPQVAQETRARERVGRKPCSRAILYAIAYIAVRNGWSLRKAEEWCKENFELLKSHGWSKRNPPCKSTLHNAMREIDVSTLQRVSALMKHLKGEIKLCFL